MNADHATTGNRDQLLEILAAELTVAAYPVVLRHGAGQNWLDLELDLWKAITESVKQLNPEILQGLSNPRRSPRASEFFAGDD